MNVNEFELYHVALLNLSGNLLLPRNLLNDLLNDRTTVAVKDDWLVPGWKIEQVLMNKDKSPYFWHGYKGIPMRLSFYRLCFFTFFSGIMYSVIKNGNIVNHWDYWQMHKYLSSDFILQSDLLYSGLSHRSNDMIVLGGGKDFDREGLMVYAVIHSVINNYFKNEKGIEDFDLFDEDGLPLEIPLGNLKDVLEIFHFLGCICFEFSLAKIDDDYQIKGKRIWGGTGMSQIFKFL